MALDLHLDLPKILSLIGTSYGFLYSGTMLNSSIFLIPALTAKERALSQRTNAAQIVYILDRVGSKSKTGTKASAILTSATLLGSAYLQYGAHNLRAAKLLATGGLLALGCMPYDTLLLAPIIAKLGRMNDAVVHDVDGLGRADEAPTRKDTAAGLMKQWAALNYGKVALAFSGAFCALLAAY